MPKWLTPETLSDERPKRVVDLIYKPQFSKIRSHFMDSIMHKGALCNLCNFVLHRYTTRGHQWTVWKHEVLSLTEKVLGCHLMVQLYCLCREVLYEHLNLFPVGVGFYPKHFKLPQLCTFIVNPLQEPIPNSVGTILYTLIYKGTLTELSLIRLRTWIGLTANKNTQIRL